MTQMASYAYADPPYLGCCKLYDHFHGDDPAWCWDDPRTHQRLIDRLFDEYPAGWALSCSVPSLYTLLPMVAHAEPRIAAWVKPFASFKPNVNPAYTWEPVIVWGGRQPRARTEPTVRDHMAQGITLRKGLTGAKPPQFCRWVMDLLGWQQGDTIVDVFPGTGIFGAVADRARGELPFAVGGA